VSFDLRAAHLTWLALRPNWHAGFAKAEGIRRRSGFPFGMRPLDPTSLIPFGWHLIVLNTGFPEESPNAKGMIFVIRHVQYRIVTFPSSEFPQNIE
jgi:hypothetical protein